MAVSVVPPQQRRFVVDDIQPQVSRTHLVVDDMLGFYGIKKSAYYGWFNDDDILKELKPRAPINTRKVLRSKWMPWYPIADFILMWAIGNLRG